MGSWFSIQTDGYEAPFFVKLGILILALVMIGVIALVDVVRLGLTIIVLAVIVLHCILRLLGRQGFFTIIGNETMGKKNTVELTFRLWNKPFDRR